MDDSENQPRDYDPAYQTGVNTFAQNGVTTANTIWTDPKEPALYTAATPSSLYVIAFALVAALIFGLPLLY